MEPYHMQAYIVAWDYLLWAIWLFFGLCTLIGIGCLILLEIANNRPPKVKPPKERESRLARFGDAISQLGNVLFFGGNQNHSISGDAFRYGRPKVMALANWLFRDADHCRHAHLKDVWLADRLISQTPSHLIVEARQLFGREM